MSPWNKSHKPPIIALHPFPIGFVYHTLTSDESPFVPSPYAASITTSARSPSLSPSASPSQNLHFTTHFSLRRSAPYAYKHQFPKPITNLNSPHTSVANKALQQLLHRGKNDIENVLLNFESKFSGSDDYVFLLRKLAEMGDYVKAIRCFEFSVQRERIKYEQVKLANAMISTLGRLGEVELAKSVFENAINAGYGKSIYLFNALISVYGRNRSSHQAISVFDSIEKNGLMPTIVTYNSVLDACSKGDVEFKKVLQIYDGMFTNGLKPDQVTFSSLLAVCRRKGLWEAASEFFNEMVNRGINPNIITYTTFLDVVCKNGQMDMACGIMTEMLKKNISPNVVTYTTMIDGYVKAGRLYDALILFSKMKVLGVCLNEVSYNIVISVYAKLGRLKEVLDICEEMKNAGIKGDVVTYTVLLNGYGKQLKYDDVKRIFEQMKSECVSPNLVTYSTLIDVYSKGGLYKEATEVLREFKQSGLKADVVIYSALIDVLCKNRLVESAVILLDEMTKEGIKPNIVTYTSIIDGLGRSTPAHHLIDEVGESIKLQVKSLYSVWQAANSEDDKVIKIFGQLNSEKACKANKGCRLGILSILSIFQKMREFEIRPDVATFCAVLNACRKCESFEDTSFLLKELQLFDPHVYGVAHGLLMGYRENVWSQAQSLFNDVKLMDSAIACNFYNALTDILWHFDQKQVTQLVALEGNHQQAWENMYSDFHLNLHLMSLGAACAIVHSWLLNLRSIVLGGHELPKNLRIVTGWGKHSKVVGDSTLREAIESLLMDMGAPFRPANGKFIATRNVMSTWLRMPETLKLLELKDVRTQLRNVGCDIN